jgi:hypothetical protein
MGKGKWMFDHLLYLAEQKKKRVLFDLTGLVFVSSMEED